MERILYPGGSSRHNGLGPKCCVIETPAWSVMFDCGTEFIPWPAGTEANIKKRYRHKTIGPYLTMLDGLKKLDAMFLTHSHLDHIGGVPLAEPYMKHDAGIYGSPHTVDVMKEKAIPDTFRISPYVYNDVRGMIQVERCLSRRKILSLGENNVGPGIRLFVVEAGHIPGAVSYIVKLPSGKKVMDTGDMGFHNQPVVPGSLIPDSIPDEWIPDSIIGTDLTNPSTKQFCWDDEKERLRARIARAFDEGIQTIVIGAFENTRGQNLALDLIPFADELDVELYIDGGIKKIADIFIRNISWSSRLPKFSLDGVIPVTSKKHREQVLSSGKRKIIITPSGMGYGGPIERYFTHGLSREDTLFLTTSYLAPRTAFDTLTRAHERGAKEIKLENEKGEKVFVPLRAAVERFHFTAHGNLANLVTLAGKIVLRRNGRPLEKIFINHATDEAWRHAAGLLMPFAKNVLHGGMGTICEL